jgi:hypothetical protein
VGGLAVALEAALKPRGGPWFGWWGARYAAFRAAICGFANRALWPICRYRLDLADLSEKRLAAQAQDPEVKAALVEVSRQWRELARQVEQLERDR